MTQVLKLGISPCPNDTFMFHDLIQDVVAVPGVTWQIELLDIEALNLRALENPPAFDITKLSLPAFAERIEEYAILSAGAALGRGCGPLVVRRAGPHGEHGGKHGGKHGGVERLDDLAGRTVAIPGEHTTASLLLRFFAPSSVETLTLRFDDIMPAVAAGEVDAGVIIHESRFTYGAHGLCAVADLGVLWEAETNLPLPLGIIAARRSLPIEVIADVERALRVSVENAFAAPGRSWPFIRAHAREMDEAVCRQHIDLYVNDFSKDLGFIGRRAIDELLARDRSTRHLASHSPTSLSPFATA